MDISLFKRLAEAHPHAVVSLRAQYRMNSDVMAVSNALIYEHKLFCATPAIASARISLPLLHMLPLPLAALQTLPRAVVGEIDKRSDWLFQSLTPSACVVFIDTDQLGDKKNLSDNSDATLSGNSAQENAIEVRLLELLMWGFSKCGFDFSNIGIISPYRAQVSAMRKSLTKRFPTADIVVGATESRVGAAKCQFDINTVDKFQGRDMEVTIISTVKDKSDSTVRI